MSFITAGSERISKNLGILTSQAEKFSASGKDFFNESMTDPCSNESYLKDNIL